MRNELEAARNVAIFYKTVITQLNEAGLHSMRSGTAPLLTIENRIARLKFAENHRNWNVDEWKQFFFKDKTRVSIKHPDGHE